MGLSRARYTEKPLPLRVADAPVQEALRVLMGRHGGWGFWKLYYRLRKNGLRINYKRSLRIYRAMGLNLPRRRTKRLPARVKQPLAVPTSTNGC
ncbi:MAG: IS3 family transposase, partial [Hymenobacter sp.]